MEIQDMNAHLRFGIIGTALVSAILCVGCDIALPGTGGASDVPCFRPTAWPEGSSSFLVRMESSDSVLIAHRTSDQAVQDLRDLIIGNDDHGPVYRLDATAETFGLVDDQVWDDATGMVGSCSGQVADDSPFVARQAGTGRVLLYNEREVPVAGGVAVGVFSGRNNSTVAVLSATGGGGIPFLSGTASSGQHYHQLFSEVDGESIGEPLRLPFSGARNPARGCWSPDNSFVLYSEASDGRFDRICIVDVRDEIDRLSENGP
jgi:hypothetical protein